jgi:hypothetical protein
VKGESSGEIFADSEENAAVIFRSGHTMTKNINYGCGLGSLRKSFGVPPSGCGSRM